MITRFGVRLLLASLLTLLGAATSASNLLFLVDGMLWAVLLVSWVFGRANLAGINAEAAFPDQVFQGTPFELALTLRKTKGGASHHLYVAVPPGSAFLPHLGRKAASAVVLPYVFPRRGLNRIADLRLESVFPFGVFRHRRNLPPPSGLAFPRIFELTGRRTSPAVREDQVSLPRRGVGDDLHGLREYGEGEDARLINWKLTAKTGTLLVKEYAQQVGNKVTITVEDVTGPAAERHICEGASLAKYYIDAGADVRLISPERTLDYGRGLLHLDLILKTLALAGPGRDPRESASPFPRFRFAAFRTRDQVPALAYLATLIGFASLFLIEDIPALLLLAFIPVFGLGRLFDRTKKYPVPKAILDILAVAFLFFFLFVDLPAAGALQAVTHLILFILLYLLFRPKSERALAQLYIAGFLAFTLTSGQALSLWYFPFFVAYFLTAGAWLIRNQDPAPAPSRPPWTGRLAAATAGAVALAALTFVLFPRPYSPRMQQLLAGAGLTRFPGSQRSFAGLTESVELGFMAPIRKNSARVMRVGLAGTTAESHPPFVRVRGTAFDVFDGKHWHKTQPEFDYRTGDRLVRARHARAWLRRERGIVYAPFFDPSQAVRPEEFVISPLLNTNLVFSVGPIAAIESSAPGAYFDFTDTVYFPSTYPDGIRYRVLSQGDRPAFHRTIQGYEDLVRTKYLLLQTRSERLGRLAADLTPNNPDPFGKAGAIEEHLRNTFSYSLAAAYGRQDVEAFLFRSRAGNCEYFATAMVLLLRHLGIPARLAIGFLSDEWNAYGRFFDVRQSDSHAWVEGFFPERGWVTFDPTPPDPTIRGRLNVFARIWTSARQYFDALQYRWYRYVVGYDTFTRRNFLFQLRVRITKSLVTILAVLLLAAATAGLAWIWKPWRLLASWKSGRRNRPTYFYDRAVERLAQAGLPRPPHQTAAEFAAGIVRDRPELKAMTALTAYHYDVRYGGRGLSPLEADHVSLLLDRLELSVRAIRRSLLASNGRHR